MAGKSFLRTVLTLAAAVATVAATSTLRGDSLRKDWEEDLDLPEGGTLLIRNDVGSIRVEPSPDGKVHLVARAAVKGGQARRAHEELDLKIDRSPSSVSIQRAKGWREFGLWDGLLGRGARVEIDYRVQVPDGLVLDLHNANGPLELDGVEGVMDLGTVNGNLVVRRAAGSVSGTSVNGKVDVEVDRVHPDARMTFDTVNGSIRTRFPGDLCARVDASSQNSSVKVDFPVRTHGTMRRSGVVGTINDCPGRADLRYRSINGSIRVQEG